MARRRGALWFAAVCVLFAACSGTDPSGRKISTVSTILTSTTSTTLTTCSSNPTMACGEVAPANSNVNINANNSYKIYPPATSTEVSAAAAVAGRIAATLPVIDGGPPVTDASVLLRLTRALHGLVPASAIQASSLAADIPSGIGYGVYVPDPRSGGCVHGWASVHGSGETVSGVSPDGGCLALLGH